MGRRHAGALPAMRLHKQSGQARIRINGREHRLGPFGSAEAQVRYDQLLAAYLASGRTSVEAAAHATQRAAPTPDPDPADLTIGDLCVRWLKTIQDDRDDWKSSSKYQGALAAARALRPVAKMPARDFGPRQLIEVRATLARTPVVQRFRDGTTGAPRPRSRSYVNETVGRIVQMFRWAVPLELVPPDKAAGLREIPRLKPGELSAVAESTERTAVDDQAVEAILSHLTGPMRALVQFLRLTGCRPSEGAILRMADVARRADGAWEYRPQRHKNKWRGQGRVIFIGPKAQAVIIEILGRRGPDAYVFDPRLAVQSRRRRAETIPMANPKTPARVRDHYDAAAIRRAIQRACDQAKQPKWFPYMLRYARSGEVRRRHGDHAAQGTLGDRSRAMLDRYAPVQGDAAAAAALATG